MTSRSKGFLDLPLELRQAVYTYMLPRDRMISSPVNHYEERTLFATCAAHESLYDELEDWIYKHCGGRLFITPDAPMDLPIGIEWHRFRNIDIIIEYL